MDEQDEKLAGSTAELVPLVVQKVEAGMSVKDAVKELASFTPSLPLQLKKRIIVMGNQN
jgi:hypothetical protein